MTTKQPDWEAIERAYRAGLLSIREIASTQGITHGAINKRAKRDGWGRNLKAKIQAKADALVSSHIPFSFFGAQNNDASVDKSPLEDLADVNILHYGNSATVEESGFISSQPTLFITTDIDPDSFIRLNPNGMHIGSTPRPMARWCSTTS